MSVAVAGTAALLFALGTYLLMQRQLSRMIIGLGLIGNGANLVILASAGRRGRPVFVGDADGGLADPLPQALILTAIVISFGALAFLLAMAYRSWSLSGADEVEDDVEDRQVATSGGRSEDVDDAEASERTRVADLGDIGDVDDAGLEAARRVER